MATSRYDTQFYDTIRAGCQRSAAVVVPLVMALVSPRRVASAPPSRGRRASYWHGEFVKHGFSLTDPLRWRIWNDRSVEPWYRQNLLLARKTSELQASMSPLSIVHPEIWDWRR